MPYARNSQLPEPVRLLPAMAQTAWRKAANGALLSDSSTTDAFRAGWRALKGDGPVSGAVHVDTPLGGRRKKPKRKTPAKKIALPAFSAKATDEGFGGLTVSPVRITAKIIKTDDEMRVVWGWASIIKEDGEVVVDSHDDTIDEVTLVKAAHEFITVRVGKAMHDGEAVAQLVESMVFTPDVAKALDIDTKGKVGWAVAFKVFDDDVWAAVKSGELPAFSIGGMALREDA